MMKFLESFIKIIKNYSFHSIPTYVEDWLGFHYSPVRRLLNAKVKTYTLRDGTRFIIRPFTYDRCIIDEIFISKVYTSNPTFRIKSGDIVVDIGAHIGVFTIFATKQAKDVKVYSYEPLPGNFKLLKANVRLNKLGHRVKMFQLAVADKKGSSPLYIGDSGLSSLNSEREECIVVETIRLEDVFDSNNLDRIDFLKVDAEGAEWNIFASTSKGYLTNIRKIALECHCPEHKTRLVQLFENLGFRVKTAQGGHPALSYLYAEKVEE